MWEGSKTKVKQLVLLKNRITFTLESVAGFFSRNNPGMRARLAFAVFLAGVFTAGVLQWSMSYGRLAYDMTYDDVGYFIDAFSRLQIFYKQGLPAAIEGIFQNPPHSPWSSLSAMTGFLFFGANDWAPYLMNGFIIFLFLGFLAYILRQIHFFAGSLIMVLVLFVPFSFFAVHEFRPDFMTALLTCAFSLLAIESFAIGNSHDKFKLRLAGLVFGITLLLKPSFFAHTLAIALIVSLFIIVFKPLSERRSWWPEKSKASLLILWNFFLPGLILAAPYYVFTWRNIWNYFWVNTRGDKAAIWNLQGSYWENFKIFTFDGAVYFMISSYLYLFAGVAVISFLLFLYKRNWRDLYILSGLLSVAVASLAIIVYGSHNNMFFGLTYQLMLCFAFCFCLASLWRNKIFFSVLLLAFVIFTGIHMVKGQALLTMFSAGKSPFAHKKASVNLKIVHFMDNYLKKNNFVIPGGEVFLSFTGDINADSMRWIALQSSLPLGFSDLHTQKDLAAYKKLIEKSDFIIVADEEAEGVYRWLPSFEMQKTVLEFLRSQPRMKEMLIIQTKKNNYNSSVRVFADTYNLNKKRNTFDVPMPFSVQGFLALEGPYPQWNLPVVCWGLLPESKIILADAEKGKYQLNLSARVMPGAQMIISVNDTKIYSHVFSGYTFENINSSFSAAGQPTVLKFQYSGINHGRDLANRAVLFQKIKLRQAENGKKQVQEKAEFLLYPDDIIAKTICR